MILTLCMLGCCISAGSLQFGKNVIVKLRTKCLLFTGKAVVTETVFNNKNGKNNNNDNNNNNNDNNDDENYVTTSFFIKSLDKFKIFL